MRDAVAGMTSAARAKCGPLCSSTQVQPRSPRGRGCRARSWGGGSPCRATKIAKITKDRAKFLSPQRVLAGCTPRGRSRSLSSAGARRAIFCVAARFVLGPLWQIGWILRTKYDLLVARVSGGLVVVLVHRGIVAVMIVGGWRGGDGARACRYT